MTRTVGDILLTSMEDIMLGRGIPEFQCRRCKISYVYTKGDLCDSCIEDIIEGENDE